MKKHKLKNVLFDDDEPAKFNPEWNKIKTEDLEEYLRKYLKKIKDLLKNTYKEDYK